MLKPSMPQSKETNGHIDADQAKVARTQNRDIIIVTFHPQTLIEPCSKPFTETFKYRNQITQNLLSRHPCAITSTAGNATGRRLWFRI